MTRQGQSPSPISMTGMPSRDWNRGLCTVPREFRARVRYAPPTGSPVAVSSRSRRPMAAFTFETGRFVRRRARAWLRSRGTPRGSRPAKASTHEHPSIRNRGRVSVRSELLPSGRGRSARFKAARPVHCSVATRRRAGAPARPWPSSPAALDHDELPQPLERLICHECGTPASGGAAPIHREPCPDLCRASLRRMGPFRGVRGPLVRPTGHARPRICTGRQSFNSVELLWTRPMTGAANGTRSSIRSGVSYSAFVKRVQTRLICRGLDEGWIVARIPRRPRRSPATSAYGTRHRGPGAVH